MSATEREKPPLSEPDEWDTFENSDWKWRNIQMLDLVYSDLSADVAAAIETIVRVDECLGAHIERVYKVDSETIEIVWYDNVGGDGKPSHVYSHYVNAVRDRIQDLFGEHWRVRRKPDGRRDGEDHPQRVLVKRADHQRFMYVDESPSEYKANLYGRPANAPDHADRYGDLSHFPDIPDEMAHLKDQRDIWTYDVGTGTKHLVRGVRGLIIGVPVETQCGRELDAETLVDGEGIRHYAEVLGDVSAERFVDSDTEPVDLVFWDLDPGNVLGEALCDRCWKRYARTVKWADGTVKRHEPPTGQYEELLDWEVSDDV